MENSTVSEAGLPRVEFFNDVGIKYESAFGHDVGLHKIIDDFLSRLPGNALVLDCGCGTGKPVSEKIANSGRSVYGIDFSQKMVELSGKQVPSGTFQHVNMLEFAPAKPFDGIIAVFSLFDLSREEITGMAAKWSQWLVPGGLILIGTFGTEDCATAPEMFDEDGKCARGIPFTFMGQKTSMTLFTKPGWRQLLEEDNLHTVHDSTDIFTPPVEARSDTEHHYYVIAQKRDQ